MKVKPNAVFVYSGSFNPLHSGHLNIAHYVKKNYDAEVVFELCRQPFGKPSVSDVELHQRTSQFDFLARPLVVTTASSFTKKLGYKYEFSSALGRANNSCPLIFCVGHDTITRISDAESYFGSDEEAERAVKLFVQNNAEFLVFPRNNGLRDGIRPSLAKICNFAEDFVQNNISSTQLRAKSQEQPLTDLQRYARRKDFS